MKKFISILLAAIMAFSVMIPAFAENEETCDCGNAPVVIVRGLDFGGLYFNPDDAENRTPLLSVDAMGIIGAVFLYSGNAALRLRTADPYQSDSRIPVRSHRLSCLHLSGTSFCISFPSHPWRRGMHIWQ